LSGCIKPRLSCPVTRQQYHCLGQGVLCDMIHSIGVPNLAAMDVNLQNLVVQSGYAQVY